MGEYHQHIRLFVYIGDCYVYEIVYFMTYM